MFLSVEWAKRWLPAVFLLLSLLLPWWMWSSVTEMIKAPLGVILPPQYEFGLSFPWHEMVEVDIVSRGGYLLFTVFCGVRFYHVAYSCFVSALILVSGLCGLSGKSKNRTLGGLLGIAGVISYFILVFPDYLTVGRVARIIPEGFRSFPYFGSAQREWGNGVFRTYSIWFLSVGFYLALAGSLMLLLPLIRTLVERLRKRL